MHDGRSRNEGAEAEQREKLSLRLAALDTGVDSTIGEVVDSLGGQAFGATMFVFAAPNLVPNPPGTSPVLGLPLLFLAVQLLLGRQVVWLPEWLRRRRVSRQFLSVLALRVTPAIGRLEKVLRPRLGLVASGKTALRLAGAVSLPLAVILLLPLPFLHMLPGAAMTAIAAGLAERDGLAVATGYVLAAVTLVAFIALGAVLQSGYTTFFGGAAT